MKKSVTLSFGQAFMSALAVAALTWGGFSFGLGWMSQSAHLAAASKMVDAALVPVCAERFIAKPGAIEAFTKAESYGRRRVLETHLPKVGPASMDYAFTNSCIEAVSKLQTAAK